MQCASRVCVAGFRREQPGGAQFGFWVSRIAREFRTAGSKGLRLRAVRRSERARSSSEAGLWARRAEQAALRSSVVAREPGASPGA